MITRIFCFLALVTAGCVGTADSGADDKYATPSVSLGKTALTERGCDACHGSDLSGVTKPITALMMFVDRASDAAACPPNLTPDDTGLKSWDQATVVRAILSGKDDDSKDLNEAMPRYGSMKMTDGEARSIAMYLKSLKAVKKIVDETPACME